MASKIPIIYWDTCVFLALLKNETRAAGEMDGLRSVYDEVGKGKVRLITSAITYMEVLTDQSGADVVDNFRKIFDRENIDAVNVDERIGMRAGEIREHYIREREPGTDSIRFADALHVGTALIYSVDALHTFDTHLLKLNSLVANHALKIEKPNTRQLSLL